MALYGPPFLFPGVVFLWLAGSLAAPLGAFNVNSDGTVTDPATELMWDHCAWGQGWDEIDGVCVGQPSGHRWKDDMGQLTTLGVAIIANAANHRGYSDWRVPNVTELESPLVVSNRIGPLIDETAFPNTHIRARLRILPCRIWNCAFHLHRRRKGLTPESAQRDLILLPSQQADDAVAERKDVIAGRQS